MNLGARGIRFAVAGGTVAIFYTTTTTILSRVVGMPFQLALAIAFTSSLVLHFTLQRVLVWRHQAEFALALHQQLWRYLSVAALQYGATALITAVAPSLLGLSVTLVYYVTFVLVSATNFLVFGARVFHAAPASEPPLGPGEPFSGNS